MDGTEPPVRAAACFFSSNARDCMAGSEMPVFTRSFDLLTWLLPATNHFPRAHRHTFTRRLLDAAFDLRERLEEANLRSGRARLERLHQADEALARLRLYLRLAQRWNWLNAGQYQHVSRMKSAACWAAGRKPAPAQGTGGRRSCRSGGPGCRRGQCPGLGEPRPPRQHARPPQGALQCHLDVPAPGPVSTSSPARISQRIDLQPCLSSISLLTFFHFYVTPRSLHN